MMGTGNGRYEEVERTLKALPDYREYTLNLESFLSDTENSLILKAGLTDTVQAVSGERFVTLNHDRIHTWKENRGLVRLSGESTLIRRYPMKLAIWIKKQPNGIYRACCPSLPGCSVFGQTHEDALAKIDIAVQGYLASLDVCLPRELKRAIEMIQDDLSFSAERYTAFPITAGNGLPQGWKINK